MNKLSKIEKIKIIDIDLKSIYHEINLNVEHVPQVGKGGPKNWLA